MVVEEVFHLSVDLVLTGFVPSKVVLGINELLFETLSVFVGLDLEFLVHLHDFGELGDGEETDLFVGGILNISSSLGISIGLLKVLEEVEDGIDGITSFGTGLEESKNLVLGTGGGGECCSCEEEHNKG